MYTHLFGKCIVFSLLTVHALGPINNLKIKPDNVYNSVLYLIQAAGVFYYTPAKTKMVIIQTYILIVKRE